MKSFDCCGLMTGINVRRLCLAMIAVFVFIFASDFLIHGLLLKSHYEATAALWRPAIEMQKFMPWMLLGQFVIAKFFTVIFAKGYEGKGLAEGVRFGLLAGGFSIGHFLIQYSVTPIPCSILMAWCGFGMVQSVLGGVIASLVYKK